MPNSTGDLGFEPRLSDPESLVLPLHQSPSRAMVRISHDLPYPTDFRHRFQDGRKLPVHALVSTTIRQVCSGDSRLCRSARFASLAGRPSGDLRNVRRHDSPRRGLRSAARWVAVATVRLSSQAPSRKFKRQSHIRQKTDFRPSVRISQAPSRNLIPSRKLRQFVQVVPNIQAPRRNVMAIQDLRRDFR